MHPFRVDIPDSQLADLRRRIADTQWPAVAAGTGWERGASEKYLRDLAGYWQQEYDWRAAERLLNRYPQFTTEIDGTNVHFLHVTSPEPSARPLLLTHGWPSSIVEYVDMIGPLTDPRSHGVADGEAFHVVIPSLPGHGFSGPFREPGWDITRIARACAELMRRLGYDTYFTAGGDWGSVISLELGRIDSDHVLGAHLTWPTVPASDAVELSQLSETDLAHLQEVSATWFDSDKAGYLRLQTTRPMTVSYGLADSPVGLLAWIIEKLYEWNKLTESPEELIHRDRLLTNVSTYWLTGTIGSSLQLYYESGSSLGALFAPGAPIEPVQVPVGIAYFRQDPAPPLQVFAGLDHSPIMHWSTFEQGGRFGPMELPELFIGDVRAFARSLPG